MDKENRDDTKKEDRVDANEEATTGTQKKSKNKSFRRRRVSYEDDMISTYKKKASVSDQPVDRDFYVDERLPKKNKKDRQERKSKRKDSNTKEPMTQKTRNMINIIICIVVVICVISVGIALSLTVLFRTDNITADDSKHYTGEEIVSACNIEYGENIFVCDKTTAEKNIEIALPYIEKANIKIKIPDTLVIEVEEAQPAYVLESKGEYVVISKDGKVLEKTDKNFSDVPLVEVLGKITANCGDVIKFEKDYIFEAITEINKSIIENKFYGIEEISVESSTNITLNYSKRIKIVLGLPIDINYKIVTAKEIIEQKLSKTDMGVLDVSNCNNDLKASYFNPDVTLFEEENPTEKPTEESTTQAYTEQSTENSTTQVYTDQSIEDSTTQEYTEQSIEDSTTQEYTEQSTEYDNTYTDENIY